MNRRAHALLPRASASPAQVPTPAVPSDERVHAGTRHEGLLEGLISPHLLGRYTDARDGGQEAPEETPWIYEAALSPIPRPPGPARPTRGDGAAAPRAPLVSSGQM